MKAVIYARYSSDSQREESIEGQIRECTAFAEKNGVKVVSATEVISEGAEGIILESVLEGYAEHYSADLSEKVIRGRTEKCTEMQIQWWYTAIGYIIDEEQHFKLIR